MVEAAHSCRGDVHADPCEVERVSVDELEVGGVVEHRPQVFQGVPQFLCGVTPAERGRGGSTTGGSCTPTGHEKQQVP